MSLFHVGEVAIVTFSCMPEFPIGREVTILEVCEPPLYGMHEFQYVIARTQGVAGINTIYANDQCLRKKRPPDADREPLGRWDECPWSPFEVSADRYARVK